MNIEQAQSIARTQEAYYGLNGVYVDPERFNKGQASWGLALNNHPIYPDQVRLWTEDLPRSIENFHRGAANLIHLALHDRSTHYQRLFRMLSAGVPDETIQLWYQFDRMGITQPFSSRPDVILGRDGQKVIEYNVDGSADKGVTEAVNTALQRSLHTQTLGNGLAKLQVGEVRRRYPQKDRLLVVTALPDGYRTKYDPQNQYFARAANFYGRDQEVVWVAKKISELTVADQVTTEIDGKNEVVDVIDREFKLPGYRPNQNFEQELSLMQAAADGRVNLLGTPLPLQDKLLLATMFDLNYLSDMQFGDADALQTPSQMLRWHAQTHFTDPSVKSIGFTDGTTYTWDDLMTKIPLEGETDPRMRFVIKRGGDSEFTTESRGIAFSYGRGSINWREALEAALEKSARGEEFWIIQQLQTPDLFTVNYLPKSRADKIQTGVFPNRFAPYYVSTGDGFQLGSILVTAGTDRLVSKRGSLNIHGQRDNTYQAAELVVL